MIVTKLCAELQILIDKIDLQSIKIRDEDQFIFVGCSTDEDIKIAATQVMTHLSEDYRHLMDPIYTFFRNRWIHIRILSKSDFISWSNTSAVIIEQFHNYIVEIVQQRAHSLYVQNQSIILQKEPYNDSPTLS